tara:strand:- start:130802 stop:131281 length:480 start_codon:yes stop_codon:yes gene_type:complete
MKLVEPGPQPPPFEVEYSELDADKPGVPQPPEEDSSPTGDSVAATTDAQPAKIPDDDSVTETPSLPAAEAAARPVDSVSDNADGADSFGAGLEVGDVAAEPVKKEQPAGEQAAAATSAEEGKATGSESDSGGKKRGKRPNRRRRSRRGQKKDGDSAPNS